MREKLQNILYRRWGRDRKYTLKEVGRELGISGSRVSQYEAHAHQWIRWTLTEMGIVATHLTLHGSTGLDNASHRRNWRRTARQRTWTPPVHRTPREQVLEMARAWKASQDDAIDTTSNEAHRWSIRQRITSSH